MQRLRLFTIEFTICLIVFFLFHWVALIDTVMFIIFVVSAFFYVFAIEELPKKDYINLPQVHYYQKSRINYYGNSMLGMLVILSIVFYTLTVKFPTLRFGIVVFILWGLMLGITYIITYVTAKTLLVDIITDYIVNYGKVGLTREEIQSVVKYLANNNKKDFKNTFHNINKKELEKVKQLFNDYSALISNPLSSEEIEELNKR